MECKWKSLPALQSVWNMPANALCLFGWSGRNWEWRSKEEDQETILQCSPCASQRTPVPARARWPLALSSRVRARDVVTLTPKVGLLLDDPSVLSWNGGNGWMWNGWMGNGWMGNGWMDGGTKEEDEK